MKCLMFLLVLNFGNLTKTTKVYKVVAEQISDKPLIDNNGFIYGSSATIFCHNGTIGAIITSRLNNSDIFITSAITLLPNGSYSAEPLEQKNILPLSFNLNASVNYPSVSYLNGTYYLLYNENNEDDFETLFAVATTTTPFIAHSWLKLKNINFSFPFYTEEATILWNGQKNVDYLFFGYLTEPSRIDFIQGPSLLTWSSPGKIKNLLKPRPGMFDGKGIHPGASPIQLQSGDYLFLYNAANKTISIGYTILNELNPSQIIQRSDKPIMEAKFSWELNDVTSNGLIKDPNGCPSNASEIIGPEYAENVECFLGVYVGHKKNVSVFRVFVGWKNFTETTTTTPIPLKLTTEASTLPTPWTTPVEQGKSSSQVSSEPGASTIAVTQMETTEARKTSTQVSTKPTPIMPNTTVETTKTTTMEFEETSSQKPFEIQSTTFETNTSVTPEATTYNEKSTTTYTLPLTTESSSKTVTIIVAISTSLFLIIVAAVIAICCYRKIKNRQSLVGIIVKQHEISDKEAKDLAKTADKYQLNSNKITVNYDEMIGSGSTATVYKGFLQGTSALTNAVGKSTMHQKYANCKVAIKIPKEMSRSESEQIMRELQAMRQIGYNAHIAALLGWCFQKDLPSLVFEVAQQDLFKYIRRFREPPDSCMPLKQILSIAWQVAAGMEYIASFNMVHRDLAARNILLFPGFHAKISDFALCCHCDESFTYQASLNKKLPVRWLSIEALIDRRFSEKSDVWAFGILLYEMCTNGSVPYTSLSNFDILGFLQSGKRLEKPETTDTKLYDLMIDCWKESIDERLNFAGIKQKLQNQLEAETQNYGYLSMTSEESEILYS